MIRIIFLGFLVGLTACSSKSTGSENLVWRLNNRGPISLSSENPFLAANLFVSKLAEGNETIYGFIKYRGAPPAIAVQSGYFGDPFVHFYYPEKRELFILEPYESTWIINGPERIPPEIQETVARLTRSLRDTPVLRVHEHPELLIPEGGRQSEAFARAGDGIMREPPGIYPPVSPPELLDGSRMGSPVDPMATLQTGMQTSTQDQQALVENRIQDAVRRLQQGPASQGAEITPQGDLVHYVTYGGETLSIIARWYTHDRANVGRLARINGLRNPDQLDIGDAIVIPSYLLKTRFSFSESDLSEMSAMSLGR